MCIYVSLWVFTSVSFITFLRVHKQQEQLSKQNGERHFIKGSDLLKDWGDQAKHKAHLGCRLAHKGPWHKRRPRMTNIVREVRNATEASLTLRACLEEVAKKGGKWITLNIMFKLGPYKYQFF